MLAFIAVGLISGLGVVKGRPKGLGLALLAGMGFGSFFILISRVSHGSVFWPLAAARLSSLLFLLAVVLIRHQKVLPEKSVWPVVLLAGALDVAGNVFFVLATHAGRLDVAAILSSLYPAVTVLLATIILKERVTQEIVFSNRASSKPVPGCSCIVEVRECGRLSRRAIGVKCLVRSELQIRKVEA